MRYIGKSGLIYETDVVGVGENGTHYGVVKYSLGDEKKGIVPDIQATTDKVELEKELRKYADENGLVLDVIDKIKRGERVLQGNLFQSHDYVNLDSEKIAEEAKRYFAAKDKCSALEAEKKVEIEKVKADYVEKILAEEETMDALKDVIQSGTCKEDCDVSWEKDFQNGIMILVRRDNLKVLNVRTMNAQEAQVSTDDQDAQAE